MMASSLLKCARLAATSGRHLMRASSLVQVQRCRAFSVTAFLADRKYTEAHEWVKVNGDVARVGISHHAQDALGDIVFVELPEEGDSFEKDQECGVVESVKAVSDIFSPLTGTIAKGNQAVVDEPALVNKSCYDDGWLFEIEMGNKSELDGLMDEDAYKKFLENLAE